MSLSVSPPHRDLKCLYNSSKMSTFLFQIVPDSTFRLFGGIDASPERGYKILIEGLVFYRNPGEWNQPMSKMIVPIPTLFQPLTMTLHIISTVEEEVTWVGFYLKVEDIRTLRTYDDWAFFNLRIRSPYGHRGAKYVRYSPTENCFGWSKFFKLQAMQNCNGNPFILDIVLEHEPMPCLFRFPYICQEDLEAQDEIETLAVEAERMSMTDKKNRPELNNNNDNSNINNTNCRAESSGRKNNKKKYKKFSSADHIYCNNNNNNGNSNGNNGATPLILLPLVSSSQGHVPNVSVNQSPGRGQHPHPHPHPRRAGHSNQNKTRRNVGAPTGN